MAFDVDTAGFSEENHRRLGYHPPRNDLQKAHFEENRLRFMELFSYLELYSEVKDSRELSLAKTALQEALMWTNAHVACNDIGVES